MAEKLASKLPDLYLNLRRFDRTLGVGLTPTYTHSLSLITTH
jgi:hypothetical protein